MLQTQEERIQGLTKLNCSDLWGLSSSWDKWSSGYVFFFKNGCFGGVSLSYFSSLKPCTTKFNYYFYSHTWTGIHAPCHPTTLPSPHFPERMAPLFCLLILLSLLSLPPFLLKIVFSKPCLQVVCHVPSTSLTIVSCFFLPSTCHGQPMSELLGPVILESLLPYSFFL